MISDILYVIFGVFGLYFGADFLIKGAGKLALKFGLSPLFIGLTVVSLGTSLPEFFVSLYAALNGKSDIVLGNVLGSNIANIGLVLGIAGIVSPVIIQNNIKKMEYPLLLFYSIIFYLMCLNGYIDFKKGIILVLGFILFLYLAYKKSTIDFINNDEIEKIKKLEGSIGLLIFEFIIGAILLNVGSEYLIKGAVNIAKKLNIAEAIIGTTMVAVGTSLPELFTSVLAAIKGKDDLGLGNVLGSNIFNLFGVVGSVSIVKKINVSTGILNVQLPAMILFTLLIIPPIYVKKKKGLVLTRIDGIILSVIYSLFIFYLFF